MTDSDSEEKRTVEYRKSRIGVDAAEWNGICDLRNPVIVAPYAAAHRHNNNEFNSIVLNVLKNRKGFESSQRHNPSREKSNRSNGG